MKFSSNDLTNRDGSYVSSQLGNLLATTAGRRGESVSVNRNLMSMSEMFLMNKPVIPDQKNVLGSLNAVASGTLGLISKNAESMDAGMMNLVPIDIVHRMSTDIDGTGAPYTKVMADPSIGVGLKNPVDSSGTMHGVGDQLSPNFHASEFYSRHNPNPPLPPAVIPALRWLCNRVLEPMRDRFGEATITSGYRPPSHNAEVGGATNSRHMYQNHPGSPAVDVRFANGTSQEWYNMADSLLQGGGGLGIYNMRSIHIDNRPGRSRWDWR